MSEKTEINPRIVDGEPVCSGSACPSHAVTFASVLYGTAQPCWGAFTHAGIMPPCIPGLRHQRDEARREMCDEMSEDYNGEFPSASEYANVRGWAYLYEGEKR